MSNSEAQKNGDIPKSGFTRQKLQSFAVVKLTLPMYEESIKKPFTVFLRVQLVKEAEIAQERFLALTDEEQEAAMPEYYAKMLSLLSVKAPENFDDFPKVNNLPLHEVQEAIYDYFAMPEGTPEGQQAMGHISRSLIGVYRRIIQPADYL